MIRAAMALRWLVAVTFTLLASMHGSRAAEPGAPTFEGCMKKAGIYTLFGGSKEYNDARRTFNKLTESWPTAVAYPASTAQVQEAVKCARQANLKTHPRCGNHANEGETVSTGSLTLDLTKMSAVKMSADMSTVYVQGGTHMGKLLAELWKQSGGKRGFPGGGRLSVGVSGFVLGGGFGSYHRNTGLGSDQIISIQAVLANGSMVYANATHNSDLLWASRGAGGGKFAIVTEFLLRTMDVTMGQTNFYYTIPYDKAIPTLRWFEKWAVGLPNRFAPRAGIEVDEAAGDGRWTYQVAGRYHGTVDETKKALMDAGLENSNGMLKLDMFTFKYTSNYLSTLASGNGVTASSNSELLAIISDRTTYEFEYEWHFRCHSLILDEPMPEEGLKLALEFAQFPGAEIEFKYMGGAVSSVPADATGASFMRTGKHLFIMRGTQEPRKELFGQRNDTCYNHAAAAKEVLDGALNSTRYIRKIAATVPAVRAYINFRDTDLPAFADYRAAYYGDNVRALECLKAKYDPEDFFHQPMDILPPSGDTSDCPALLKRVGDATAAYSKQLKASLQRLKQGGAKPMAPSNTKQQATTEKSP